MFAEGFDDRQVATGLAAGQSAEPGISDAETFYAKLNDFFQRPDGTTALELVNKRARFELQLPYLVASSILARDVVMITASPSSLAVSEVVVMHKDSKGRPTEQEIVWNAATNGPINLTEVTYWKKSADSRVEEPRP